MEKKTFTLFWLTGDSELVKGYDIAHAITSAGYGAGAMGALDFHAPGDQKKDYTWDPIKKTWKSNNIQTINK